MRMLFLMLLCFSIKAQQSAFSFTTGQLDNHASITCDQPYVKYVAASDYTLSPVSFSWTNGSVVYTGTLVSITSPGSYSATAYTASSLSQTTVFQVNADIIAPSSTVTPLSQGIVCNQNNALVTASATIQFPIHYFVSPLGGTLSAQGQSANYFPGTPGTYTHVLIDSLNGCRTQKTFTITPASGFPTFSLSSAEDFTLGCNTKSVATVTITNASTDPPGGTLSYTITSSSPYATGNASVYSFTGAGSYTVIVKDNSTNCESRTPVSIMGNSVVPQAYGTGFLGTLSCKQPARLMHYYQSTPGNYTFGWGATGFVLPPVIIHPYDTITVAVDPTLGSTGYWGPWAILINNDNACMFAYNSFVDQDIELPDVLIKKNYNSITCQHPQVMLSGIGHSNSPSMNASVSAYLWMGPSPQSSSTLSSGYIAYTGGIYAVYMRDNANGCTNTDTIFVGDTRVYPQVSAPAQSFLLCNAIVAIQPVNSSTVPLVFAWNSGTNSILSNPSAQQISVNSAGIYTVLVTDPATTCSVSLQLTVDICTGITEPLLPEPYYTLYPNPGNGYAFIETNAAREIVITDARANVMTRYQVQAGKNRIDLEQYPGGIYFIQVREKGRTVKTLKYIRQN